MSSSSDCFVCDFIGLLVAMATVSLCSCFPFQHFIIWNKKNEWKNEWKKKKISRMFFSNFFPFLGWNVLPLWEFDSVYQSHSKILFLSLWRSEICATENVVNFRKSLCSYSSSTLSPTNPFLPSSTKFTTFLSIRFPCLFDNTDGACSKKRKKNSIFLVFLSSSLIFKDFFIEPIKKSTGKFGKLKFKANV